MAAMIGGRRERRRRLPRFLFAKAWQVRGRKIAGKKRFVIESVRALGTGLPRSREQSGRDEKLQIDEGRWQRKKRNNMHFP